MVNKKNIDLFDDNIFDDNLSDLFNDNIFDDKNEPKKQAVKKPKNQQQQKQEQEQEQEQETPSKTETPQKNSWTITEQDIEKRKYILEEKFSPKGKKRLQERLRTAKIRKAKEEKQRKEAEERAKTGDGMPYDPKNKKIRILKNLGPKNKEKIKKILETHDLNNLKENRSSYFKYLQQIQRRQFHYYPPLITLPQLSILIGINERLIAGIINSGRIPHHRLPDGNIRFFRDEIYTWIQSLPQTSEEHEKREAKSSDIRSQNLQKATKIRIQKQKQQKQDFSK